ncbi:unnamed protein product [Fusarium equiseti]|uniref:Uncharacterized protein n=1 Tax=Fusarium equiseti TaxID=61235 RepID=A0A8J2IDL3_FUSEQ|nr:unnamed protein product [Fusarium equiseti]
MLSVAVPRLLPSVRDSIADTREECPFNPSSSSSSSSHLRPPISGFRITDIANVYFTISDFPASSLAWSVYLATCLLSFLLDITTQFACRSNPIPSSSTTGPRLVTARSSTQKPHSGIAKKFDVSWIRTLSSKTRQSKQNNRQPLPNISTNTPSGNAKKLNVSQSQRSKQDNRQPLLNTPMSTPSSGGNKKLGLSQLRPVPSLSLKSRKNDIPASDDQDFPKLRLKPVNGVPYYRATW